MSQVARCVQQSTQLFQHTAHHAGHFRPLQCPLALLPCRPCALCIPPVWPLCQISSTATGCNGTRCAWCAGQAAAGAAADCVHNRAGGQHVHVADTGEQQGAKERRQQQPCGLALLQLLPRSLAAKPSELTLCSHILAAAAAAPNACSGAFAVTRLFFKGE